MGMYLASAMRVKGGFVWVPKKIIGRERQRKTCVLVEDLYNGSKIIGRERQRKTCVVVEDLYNVRNMEVSTYKWCCNCLAGGESKHTTETKDVWFRCTASK